jgi:hypothetical protein
MQLFKAHRMTSILSRINKIKVDLRPKNCFSGKKNRFSGKKNMFVWQKKYISFNMGALPGGWDVAVPIGAAAKFF